MNLIPAMSPQFSRKPGQKKRFRLLRVDLFLLMLMVLSSALMLRLHGIDCSTEQGSSCSAGGPFQAVAETENERTYSTITRQQVAEMPRTGPPVRFLMLNVGNYFVAGEKQRSRHTMQPKSEKARDAVAEVIASVKPELVGLIEIGGPLALEDLKERLRASGLDYPHSKVLVRGGEDRALALLSMHPIVQDASRANYGLYGQQRRRMLRGILDITCRLSDGRMFRIIGAHLKSRVGADFAATASLREREAHTLAGYIHAIMKEQPELPVLVYGDWNDDPGDASVRLLQQGTGNISSLNRLRPVDSRGEEWTLYYRRGNTYHTFDQIFVNKPLKKRLKRGDEYGVVDIPAAQQASDHRAVWCELR